MAEYKLLLPSMGEGVMEATIISWMFNEGDSVNEDDSVVEIATDKVDSDVPTPVSGKIIKILKQKDEIAKIGEAIAILEVAGEGDAIADQPQEPKSVEEVQAEIPNADPEVVKGLEEAMESANTSTNFEGSDLYLSPLVKSIAQEEKISDSELQSIKGTGLEGRITKENILAFIATRKDSPAPQVASAPVSAPPATSIAPAPATPSAPIKLNPGDEIIQMDRVRKIIADAMVKSKHTSPHVTSFIESDLTNVFSGFED